MVPGKLGVQPITDGEVQRRGFVLKEEHRQMLSNKLMLQAPQGMTPDQIIRTRRDLDRVVDGLPGDVFMALDALRLLADQGSEIAKLLFDSESERLGLTRPFFTIGR